MRNYIDLTKESGYANIKLVQCDVDAFCRCFCFRIFGLVVIQLLLADLLLLFVMSILFAVVGI
jgi:hypothetical protein